MYHFVEPHQIGAEEIRIEGADVNHIRNVLRMKPGEKILISSVSAATISAVWKNWNQSMFRQRFWKNGKTMSFRRGFTCSRDFRRAIRWN